MSVLQFLFSFRGRIGRLRWWLVGLVQLAALTALIWFALAQAPAWSTGSAPASGAIMFLVGLVVLVWSSLAIYAKRLHDRNRGAIWLLAVVVPAILPQLHPLGMIPSLISTVWIFVELGCMRGTDGPNRFDLQPAAGRPARTDRMRPDAPAQRATRSGGTSSLDSAFAAIEAAARTQPQASASAPRTTTPHYAPQTTFGQRKPGTFGTKR